MSPTFAQLGVPDFICAALKRRDITHPFEIQAATIEDALAGKDVCGRAPTGSGKTLAFGIPLVARVDKAEPHHPRGLVLAPTRELADQITAELRSFAGRKRIGVVFGGVPYGAQIRSLRQGVEILVACPGRLEDLIDRGDVDLSQVDHVVLDEADRMADMGFMPAVRRLLDQTNSTRQTVLFSATLDGDIAKLTRDYQHQPVRHEIGEETPDITSASHVFWKTAREDRLSLTAEAVHAAWPAIVFCRTRHGSDRLAKQLKKKGIEAAAIHGGRSQNQRTRALGDFTAGRVHALVATDVAARGIHVDGVASVVHYDPPEDFKTYVHRSGRTARAGEEGVVVSLVQPDQVKDLKRMQRKIGLDEPFIAPNPAVLWDLSPATTGRQLAPAEKPVEQNRRPDGGQGSDGGNRSGGGNRSRNGQRKSAHGKAGQGRSGSGKGRNRNKNQRDNRNGESRDDNRGGQQRSDGEGRDGRTSSDGRRSSSKPKRGGQSSRRNSSGSSNSSSQKRSSTKSRRNSSGSKSNGSGSNSGGTTQTAGKRPNRKARRAHLQPGNRG